MIETFNFSISPKRLMLLGMFAQIVSGCLTGLVNNYWLHVFFRCTSAICCGQMYTGGQVICKFIFNEVLIILNNEKLYLSC